MSDQIFTQAPSPVPAGAFQSQQHRACAVLDAENPEQYRFNHLQHDVQGTLVPVPSPNGGIKGSTNPFGKIVVGDELRMVNGRLQSTPFKPIQPHPGMPHPLEQDVVLGGSWATEQVGTQVHTLCFIRHRKPQRSQQCRHNVGCSETLGAL